MKFRHLSALLFFILFVHHSYEQDLSGGEGVPYDGSPAPGTIRANGDAGSNAVNDMVNTSANVNNNLVGSVRGSIRNTTNTIVQGIGRQRDRVLQIMRPAIRSEFSRNVTNVLSTIWARAISHAQDTNSSIVRSPLFRNSIIIPINTTMTRLREMTSGNDETANFEVINLNNPEGEKELRNFLAPNANAVDAASNPPMIFLVRDDEDKPKPADKATASESHSEIARPKNKRSPRFMDRYYYNRVEPSRVRDLFDSVQRQNMQECMALALCESNCRPHLYSESRAGLFRRMFDRVETFGMNHADYEYYLNARRHGQRYSGSHSNECHWCHARYHCPQERAQLVDRLYSMGRFD